MRETEITACHLKRDAILALIADTDFKGFIPRALAVRISVLTADLFPDCMAEADSILRRLIEDKRFKEPIASEVILGILLSMQVNNHIESTMRFSLELVETGLFPQSETLLRILDEINLPEAIPAFRFCIEQHLAGNELFDEASVELSIHFLRAWREEKAWDLIKRLPLSEDEVYLRSIADFIVGLDLVDERFKLLEIFQLTFDPNAMKMIVKALGSWGKEDTFQQLTDLAAKPWMQGPDYIGIVRIIEGILAERRG